MTQPIGVKVSAISNPTASDNALPPDKAGIEAALVVLAGAVGSVVLGAVADRAGFRRAAGKFIAIASLCALTAVVIGVIHPGVRATGDSVLPLFQNLFGLAAGPYMRAIVAMLHVIAITVCS